MNELREAWHPDVVGLLGGGGSDAVNPCLFRPVNQAFLAWELGQSLEIIFTPRLAWR